jgi:hypothetical protein
MEEQEALRETDTLVALDVDAEMVEASKKAAREIPPTAQLEVREANYLTASFEEKFDYAILNPPYIRQEWIEKKGEYRERFREEYGLDVPGTSNLYVYFIAKTLMDLRVGGRFACVVYDSWRSTRYGNWLKGFLAERSDFEVETAPRQPFDGRLIDATLIFGQKKKKGEAQAGNGGNQKSLFAGVEGFSRIDDLFSTRRGLRLKQADFFLCQMSEADQVGATPFVKKVGGIDGYLVPPGHSEAALLTTSKDKKRVDPKLTEELERRLEVAKRAPRENEPVLNWHEKRPSSWFRHPSAPKAPIIFNYYLRNRPRHLHNPERAYSDNFYGVELSPDDRLVFAWLAVLNSTCVCAELFANARNQGNGLAKLQLYEYRRACIPDISRCTPADQHRLGELGEEITRRPVGGAESLIQEIDTALASIFSDDRLLPLWVEELYADAASSAKRPRP